MRRVLLRAADLGTLRTRAAGRRDTGVRHHDFVRYWWVNHKQTFRHEFEGGYVWSPKRKRDGSQNRYYDFLRAVVPGDVVFSYAGGAVQGAGFAASYCYTCPRPAEFGHIGEAWDIVGWRVDVRFQRFGTAVRPKNHL